MGDESAEEGKVQDSEGKFQSKDMIEKTRKVVVRAQLESLTIAAGSWSFLRGREVKLSSQCDAEEN